MWVIALKSLFRNIFSEHANNIIDANAEFLSLYKRKKKFYSGKMLVIYYYQSITIKKRFIRNIVYARRYVNVLLTINVFYQFGCILKVVHIMTLTVIFAILIKHSATRSLCTCRKYKTPKIHLTIQNTEKIVNSTFIYFKIFS